MKKETLKRECNVQRLIGVSSVFDAECGWNV
ncbi:MAG: hypothetical protein ACI9OU_001268 [Candidatus Promineifilaceae bacterium]|jgi:hypothetical protein